MSDLPRKVPVDERVPEPLRETHIYTDLAADTVGVSEVTLRKHLRRGTLAGIKISHTWLVSREDLQNWEPGTPGNPNWIKQETA